MANTTAVYARDEQYLEKAFPAMWSCAQFWFERLKRAPDGTYEAPDEYSPEQNAHPKEDATAHAQQLIYDLFTNVDQAQKILGSKRTGLTSDDISRLKDYLAHTPVVHPARRTAQRYRICLGRLRPLLQRHLRPLLAVCPPACTSLHRPFQHAHHRA